MFSADTFSELIALPLFLPHQMGGEETVTFKENVTLSFFELLVFARLVLSSVCSSWEKDLLKQLAYFMIV